MTMWPFAMISFPSFVSNGTSRPSGNRVTTSVPSTVITAPPPIEIFWPRGSFVMPSCFFFAISM